MLRPDDEEPPLLLRLPPEDDEPLLPLLELPDEPDGAFCTVCLLPPVEPLGGF